MLASALGSIRREGGIWLAVVVVLVCFRFPIAAQTTRSSGIAGNVSGTDGGGIPAAHITLVHVPTGDTVRTTTRPDGGYTLAHLRVGGPYRISVSHIGYTPQARTGVHLRVAETVRIDFLLRERALEGDEVVVSGIRGEVLSGTTTGAFLHVDRDRIEQLPLPAATLEDAARLSPYIVGGSALGRNFRYNDIQVDGVSYTDQFGLLRAVPVVAGIGISPISFEAVEEFQVNLSPFDVSRSGFTGGAFDAVTRSGTNRFQGSVHLDALTGWSMGKSPDDGRRDMPDFLDARTGFQGGGPVGQTGVFYFVAGELNRLSFPVDRAFGARTPGGTVFTIPAASVSSLMKQLDTVFNYGTGSFDLVFLERHAASLFARLDASLAERHRLSLRYSYFRTEADRTPEIPGVYSAHAVSRNITTTHRLMGEFSSLFGNDLANQLLVSYTARDFTSGILGEPFPFVDVSVVSQAQQWNHLLTGSDGGAVGGWSREHVLDLQNSTSLYRGSHTLTFGMQGELHWFDVFLLDDQYGRYLFRNAMNLRSQRPLEYQLRYVRDGEDEPGVAWRALQLGAYFQDEWTVSPMLRITFGMRVDVPLFLDRPGENPSVRELFRPLGYDIWTSRLPASRPLFSPRVSFNINPKGDRTAQIRGGVGVLTGRVPYVWLSNQFAHTGMKYVHIKENANVPLLTADPFGQPRPGAGTNLRETAEINVTDRDFSFPQVLRGTFAMDYALPWDIVASLEVVFSRSINEVVYRNINLKRHGEVNPEMSGDRRPTFGFYNSGVLWDPGSGRWEYSRYSKDFTSVILLSNADGGSSLNNTIQLQRKPNGAGLFFSAAYTYGNTKDINSGTSDQAYAQWKYNPAYDPNRPQVNYSAFDREHRIVLAASYRFAWGSGWAATLGAVYTGLSGQPFSYVYDGDINGDGELYNDLFYVPGTSKEQLFVGADGQILNWTDTTYMRFMEFILNDPYLSAHRGRVVERNGARTPWSHIVDVRLAVELPVAEGHSLELHGELFNLLNLLDPAKGIVRVAPAGIVPILQLHNLDPIGRPQFRWAGGRETPLVPEVLGSRWRVRFGMRYTF